MNKLIEIVVTHWTEPWEVGSDAFKMLSIQRRVNWDDIQVTMIHDGSDAFPDEYFSGCPFCVSQVCIPHGGISAARNYAIKNCSAQWIKFCDFDDMFAGVYSVSCIMDTIAIADYYDELWFPMIIDVFGGGLDIKNGSPVFVHDKIFRTSFLHDHHILFNERLTYSEDFAFLSLLNLNIDMSRIGKIECNFPLYVFIQRVNSVSNNPSNWFRNRVAHNESLQYVEDILREYGRTYDADTMAVRVMSECYCTLQHAVPPESTDFVLSVIAYYNRHRGMLDKISDSDLDEIIDITNTQNQSNISKAKFVQWIHILDSGALHNNSRR